MSVQVVGGSGHAAEVNSDSSLQVALVSSSAVLDIGTPTVHSQIYIQSDPVGVAGLKLPTDSEMLVGGNPLGNTNRVPAELYQGSTAVNASAPLATGVYSAGSAVATTNPLPILPCISDPGYTGSMSSTHPLHCQLNGTPSSSLNAVHVYNTPNVSVTNTPSVSVSGTPNVSVTNTPSVTTTPATIVSQTVTIGGLNVAQAAYTGYYYIASPSGGWRNLWVILTSLSGTANASIELSGGSTTGSNGASASGSDHSMIKMSGWNDLNNQSRLNCNVVGACLPSYSFRIQNAGGQPNMTGFTLKAYFGN